MPNRKDDVYGDHISGKFNDELNEPKTQFLNMGGMVESQVEQAIQSLVDSDGQLAEKVRLGDKLVDKMKWTWMKPSWSSPAGNRQPGTCAW